ncbi:glycosyltransferase family 4 protein [Nocardioides sp. SYSU D00038]|uniref:glycosyltransferase family 4 protein n=1 Tax=Nocardioides sp. SYSU D00038 TaxID=2812554 RepID=UPI001967EE65|nr:glycosyltransferase family 4 protein [Nocardioides sp. SYSU D00038]
MPRTPRIGMISTRCQPEIGGIENHVAEVAGRLAARGYDLEVLTTDTSGRLPRRERVDGYLVRRFRAWPRSRDWYLSPGLFLAALRARYDVVHVQGVHTLVPPLAMLAAILRRVPFLLTFHTGGSSSAFRERARGTQWRVLAPLLRRAHTLIGVSVYEARRFDEVLGEPGRVTVVRNGGSLPEVPPGVVPEPGLVVSVGRLERYKGHHRLVEALPHLLETVPEARVEVLGAGPYEAELLALAERLGVADRVTVRFVPPVDRAAMGESIARAGVMTLLSDYEAHPVAVMEALTAGRPVVVSRTSGLIELADLGWAVGVEADASPRDTAAAIARQMSDPVLPAREDLPTWETCVTGVAQTYDAIMAATRKGADVA